MKKSAEENEIAVIERNVHPIAGQIESIVVDDLKSMTIATGLLSQANRYLDSVVAYKKTKTDPINQALKVIRAETKPVESLLEGLIDGLRTKLGEYHAEQIRIREEAEAKIIARVAPGSGNLSIETAAKRMEAIEKPVEKIETDAGTLKFRATPVLKVIDEAYIPREYFDLNESRLTAALKSGITVKGAVLEIKQVPINSR